MKLKNYQPRFLYTPPSWFQPLDWQVVFGNPQPVEVDLGCGDGSFLIARARHHPERNFLGVERLLGRARKVDRKAQQAGLSNVRVLRIESGYAVNYLFPPASVAVFHLYFPDPWPKKRHQKRRLVQPDFVNALARTLMPGGEVRLATDHAGYFADILATFRAAGEWQERPMPQPPPEEQTDFERDFVARGMPIQRVMFVRAEGPGGAMS